MALFFTKSKRLKVYLDIVYLFNFRIMFALVIIGIISGILTRFVRFRIESRNNSRCSKWVLLKKFSIEYESIPPINCIDINLSS